MTLPLLLLLLVAGCAAPHTPQGVTIYNDKGQVIEQDWEMDCHEESPKVGI